MRLEPHLDGLNSEVRSALTEVFIQARRTLHGTADLNAIQTRIPKEPGNLEALAREAVKQGMRTLRDSGLLAIYDGLTSLDEVVKETIVEE